MNLLDLITSKRQVAESTNANVKKLKNFMVIYLREEFGKRDYPINKIDQEFWRRFQEFSLKKGHSPNYILAHLAMINSAINSSDDTIKIVRIKNIVKKEKTKHRFLTQEQVEEIAQFPENEKYNKARDLFLFQCSTGIAYDDLVRLSKINIVRTQGHLFLQYIRGKTEKRTQAMASVLLSERALDIFKKYKYDMRIKYHTYDRRLKDIGKELEIELSTHVARHTFGTLMVEEGWPLQMVGSMMAHTSTNTTQIYSKTTNRSLIETKKRLSLINK